jgi:hypothetical protein
VSSSSGAVTATRMPSQRERARISPQALLVMLATVTMGLRMVVVVWRNSVNLPYQDQWDFYTPLFQNASWWKTFQWQHGPHREGIGLVLDRIVLGWTHWSATGEALLIAVSLIAAASAAVWLKVRLFGRIDYSDIIIPIVFLTSAQIFILLGVANPSYSAIPELLIVLYCLAWTLKSPLGRYGTIILLNFLLIYTGFGIFMGFVTLGLLLLDVVRTLRMREPLLLPAIVLGFAVLSLASFFYDYRWSPAAACFVFPDPHALNYPWFVSALFSYFLGIRRPAALAAALGTVLTFTFLVLLIRYAWKLCKRNCWANRDVSISALLSFSLLFAVNAAVGRVCLGLPDAAIKSNYMGLLVPAFLGMYFCLLSLPTGLKRTVAISVFVIVLAPNALRSRRDRVNVEAKRSWQACYSKTEDIEGCNRSTGVSPYPETGIAATHLKEKLDYLKHNRLSLFR